MNMISIIIPIYNSEKSIIPCIDSILSQTFTAFELILIDDGSSDNSSLICDEYAKKDSRIKVVHKVNGGVSAARNTGLDMAEGTHIVFVDSDDTIDSSYLETLSKNAEYDFVTAGFRTQGPDGRWHEQRFCEEMVECKTVSSYPSKYMGKYYFGAPWSKLYKKEIIDKYNIRFPVDVHNGEDTIFIFNYLLYTSIVKIVPYSGYNYFFYKTSLAHKVTNDNFKWRIQVERHLNSFFQPCNRKEKEWLDNRCFDVLVGQVKEHFPYIKKEVYSLYNEDVFANGILLKKSHGKFMERLFVFTMEHKCFEVYLKVYNIEVLFVRIKNKIKRTFLNWG